MPAKKRTRVMVSPPPVAAPASTRLLGQIVPVVALLGLAFLVYGPALGAGFIWDDGRAITDNPLFASAHPLADIWSGRGDADYLPLKTTLLWLLYQIFGTRTWPYHVANVAVHALNAVLLWRVLRRLAIPGAFWAGLVFLVHPTHVESVAWVSECKNTLAAMFGLLALLAWLAHRRGGGAAYYLAALVLFVAGLLCKSHLVFLPIVFALCAWWQEQPPAERSGAPARAGTRAESRPGWRASLAPLAPFLAVAVLVAVVTVSFQSRRAIAEYRLPVGGLPSRVANAGKAVCWYLGKAVSPRNPWYEMPSRPVETEPEAQAVLAGLRSPNPAPALPWGRITTWPLSMIYPRWRVTTPVWYDYLPAAAVLALYAWAVRRRAARGRGIFFASSYFLVALLPVLGLLKMSYMRAAWVADHFQYFADIGVIALGAAGGVLLWRRLGGQPRWLVGVLGGSLVAAYAGATLVRAAAYRSEYTMWTDTVAKNPGACQAQVRLGAALLARNETGAAAAHFEQAVRCKPDDADSRNNLGIALVSLGRVEEGIGQYRESLRLDGAQFFAYANLGDALAGQRRYAEAAAAYRDAIRLRPGLAPLHFRMAAVLLEDGEVESAIAALKQADALAPNHPEIAAALARAVSRRAALQPLP